MTKHRQFVTPGRAAVPETLIPAADDLGLEGDGIDEAQPASAAPSTLEGFSPEQAAQVERMLARAVAAARSADQEAQKSAATAVVSMAQAKADAEAAIAAGTRPRAVLTPAGWYCHPEMSRVKTVGVGS